MIREQQQVPDGKKILSLLIDLLADQNKAQVKYTIEESEKNVSH